MKEFQLQPFFIKPNSANSFLNWKATRYLFLFSFISLPLGSLSMVNYQSQIGFFIARLVQLALFLSLGILHSESLAKRQLFMHYSIKEKSYFSFVLALLQFGALLLFSFMVKSDMQFMAVVSSCAFLLPYMVVQAWNYYLALPENRSMIWNGYKQVVENPDIVYLNTILIQIRLAKRPGVKEESTFLINLPLHLELGKLFNSFVNIENKDGNAGIECVGENNTPFMWKFFLVSFGGMYKKILDPEKTLRNNGSVKRNTTIIAKRVNA